MMSVKRQRTKSTPSILARLPMSIIKYIRTFYADQCWLPINVYVSGRLTGEDDVYRKAFSIRLVDANVNETTVLARYGMNPAWRPVTKQHLHVMLYGMLVGKAIEDWFVLRPTDNDSLIPVGSPRRPGMERSCNIRSFIDYLDAFPLLLGTAKPNDAGSDDRYAKAAFQAVLEAYVETYHVVDTPPLVDDSDDMPPLVDDSDGDDDDLAYWVYCDMTSSYPMQA